MQLSSSMIIDRLTIAAASGYLAAMTACGTGADSANETAGAAVSDSTGPLRYTHEYVFVASGDMPPTVAPFTFRAVDEGEERERTARAWLARGATWDRFLDESVRGSSESGVWMLVPQGNLRIMAGGSTEIETLRFDEDERRLRLDLNAPLTSWSAGGDSRFRLLAGRLSVGQETLPGAVFEVLRVERLLTDQWPPTQDFDALFLTSGDSIQLALAESIGENGDDPGYAWIKTPRAERVAPRAEIRWLEMRPFQDARRDIPRRWRFGVAEAGIEGEVEAVGFDAVLGPERGGRRAVEIRFTVEGWFEMDGARRPVAGMIRHAQQ